MKDGYEIILQAVPDEILEATSPSDLIIEDAMRHRRVADVVVALPEMDLSDAARAKLNTWGVKSYVGDTYNVASRMLSASKSAQPFIVRLLAVWKHADFDLIDRMVDTMSSTPVDYLAVTMDFDVTMAADIASKAAIQRISDMSHPNDHSSPTISRALFNPFGYMELHPHEFKVAYFSDVPTYLKGKVKSILKDSMMHPENEFYGRDYTGSRYDFLLDYIRPGGRVLDIACGSGYGSNLISKKSKWVLGCDHLKDYVNRARERYPESESLEFSVVDGQSFLYRDGEFFDIVISLHTLEHVPNDKAMMNSLARNLKRGGLAIIEVPLLALRPLGVPINPYHLREYTIEGACALVEGAGLTITKRIGCSRGFAGPIELARDAIQIHAVKP